MTHLHGSLPKLTVIAPYHNGYFDVASCESVRQLLTISSARNNLASDTATLFTMERIIGRFGPQVNSKVIADAILVARYPFRLFFGHPM